MCNTTHLAKNATTKIEKHEGTRLEGKEQGAHHPDVIKQTLQDNEPNQTYIFA